MGAIVDSIRDIVRTDPLAQAYGSFQTIQRPANTTAYTANDAVGTLGTALLDLGQLGPKGGRDIVIQSTRLTPRLTAVPAAMGNFRLALYSAPAAAIADNGAWTIAAADLGSFIDTLDLGTPALPAVGAQALLIARDNIGKQIRLPNNGHLYAYLVTDGGFTPAANSETYGLEVRTLVL